MTAKPPSKGGAGPKRRGTRFEATVVAAMRRHGWPLAVRSYASKGPWDVLAVRPQPRTLLLSEVWLIQAKVGGSMRPAERVALREAADAINAIPVLATVERRRLHFYLVTAASPRGDELDPSGS